MIRSTIVKQKLDEVFIVEPNNLGLVTLTNIYKKLTKSLKIVPFVYLIPLSLLIVLLVYYLLGIYLVRLVSLLQYGF